MVMCTNYINWSWSESEGSGYYDVNGTYKDLTEYAGYLMLIFQLYSVATGQLVAAYIFETLGMVFDTINFTLSTIPLVECEKHTIIWRAATTTKSSLIEGARCEFTLNKKSKTAYDGSYYSTTAIADHNSTLALTPYTNFFPGSDRYEIASWPF